MAITYPRSYPDDSFSQVTLNLLRRTQRNELASGEIQVLETVDPVWYAKISTNNKFQEERRTWRAWGASLRGGTKTFYFYDPDHRWPQAYGDSVLGMTRSGGGTFDGTCTVTSASGNTIGLSHLPADFVMMAGDHVSIPMTGNQQSLHIVLEDATANGSGVISLNVEPYIRAGATINSTAARVVKAHCIMVIKDETFLAPAVPDATPVSFEAVQTLAAQP